MTTNFSGPFAYTNWTAVPDTGFITPLPSSINTTSVTFVSGNSGGGVHNTNLTITIPFNTTISFNWNYNTSDLPPFVDPFRYIINGTITKLSNDFGPGTQSGTVTLNLNSGDIFTFNARTGDGFGGPATTIISSFNFTSPPPPVPCFSKRSISSKQLPSGAVIVSKNIRNNKWIYVNGILLTRDHVIKHNGELMTAEQFSSRIINYDDEVVDIYTSDGRFITFECEDIKMYDGTQLTFKNIEFATNKLV